MVGKKVILASLLALLSIPLCGQQKSDKTSRKNAVAFLYDASDQLFDMIDKGTNLQKCSRFLKEMSDAFDDKSSVGLFKKIQKLIPVIRRNNRTIVDNYQNTKNLLRSAFISCIKNHSNQKKECQNLVDLYTQFLTGVSLKKFLSVENELA